MEMVLFLSQKVTKKLPNSSNICPQRLNFRFCCKAWFPYSRKDPNYVLRPCPKDYTTALQVSIARIACERLLLSKTCVTVHVKNCVLIAPIILTASLVHGYLFKTFSIIPSVFVTYIPAFANSFCKS